MPFHCEKHCNLLQILLGKPSVTYKFYLARNKDIEAFFNDSYILGVVFPHRNFFPWGMGKNGEGKFFSHGEMGKNGESYFGFELTKNGIKSTI